MDDPVINGIKQRQDSNTLDYGEGVIIEMEFLFNDYGLPSPYDWHGNEFFEFMQDVAELVQRMHDAENTDRDAEARFLRRQVTYLCHNAKERWHHLTGSPQ